MIDIFIDKQEIVMPEDFSLEVVKKNPLYTKMEDYTYDITISLLDPQNSIIYGSLNREHSSTMFTQRDVDIYVDARLYLSGKETILEWTDTSVKIQVIIPADRTGITQDTRKIRNFITLQEPRGSAGESISGLLFASGIGTSLLDPTSPLMDAYTSLAVELDNTDMISGFYPDIHSVYAPVMVRGMYMINRFIGYTNSPTQENMSKGLVDYQSVVSNDGYEYIQKSPAIAGNFSTTVLKPRNTGIYLSIKTYRTLATSAYLSAYGQHRRCDAIGAQLLGTDNQDTFNSLTFLAAFVDNIFTNLGFTIKENFIATSPIWSRLLVISQQIRFKYRMPDWTVSELVDQIGRLCNVVFLSENGTDLYIKQRKGDDLGYIYLSDDEVEDGFSSEIVDVDDDLPTYDGIRYALPDNEYYKYQNINDFVRKLIGDGGFVIPESLHQAPAQFASAMQLLGINSYTKGTYKGDGSIINRQDSEWLRVDGVSRQIDMYRPTDSHYSEMELKIIPAEMAEVPVWTPGAIYPMLMPVVDQENQMVDTPTDPIHLKDLIEDGEQENKGNDYIQVAFWDGKRFSYKLEGSNAIGGEMIPGTHTSDVMEFKVPITVFSLCEEGQLPVEEDYELARKRNLKLRGANGLWENQYKGSSRTYFQKETTIRLYTDKDLDTKKIFVIRNKKYVCKELKYTIQSNTESRKEIEGVFWELSK